MLKRILRINQQEKDVPKEGDLYARIEHEGRTFELYYGYYEECDRQNPMVHPVPLYPNFVEHPQYDNEGYPFATEMQDACRYYEGKPGKYNDCAECQYYLHGDELLGICTCPKNKRVTHPKNSQEEAK